MTAAILAADLGGSGFRAALFARDGAPLAVARRDHAPAAEADAESWLATLNALVGELFGAVPDARVDALAITAFARSEVLVDAAGAPLRPAFTLRDARAGAEARALDPAPRGATAITAHHVAARLAWVRAHEPAVFAAIAHVLPAKDFLNFRLTGRVASDPASNAPLAPSGRHARLLLDAARLQRAWFARLRAPRAPLGRVRRGLPGALARLAGAYVAVSSMDAWCATLGLGAHRAGLGYNLSGTSEVNGVMLARRARAPGLVSLPWDVDAEGATLFHLGGPSQAGADCLAWLAGVTGADVETLVAEAERADLDSRPLVFLPYLHGERVPFWDPGLRGGFAGLARDHTRGDLARAVMEGVALHDRLVFERAARAAGGKPEAVLVAGGGASSDLWCRIKADAWGCELRRPAGEEPGLRGAFLLARGTVEPDAVPLAPPDAVIFRPDSARAPRSTRATPASAPPSRASASVAKLAPR